MPVDLNSFNPLCDDLIGHEFSHVALDWWGTDDGEEGAIREGFCDIFGEWIDQYNDDCYGHAYDSGTGFDSDLSRSYVIDQEYGAAWDFMEDGFSRISGTGYFQDPTSWIYPRSPNDQYPAIYYGDNWDTVNQDRYINCAVVAKLVYLICEGSGGVPFNGITVAVLSGDSMAKAAKLLWYVKVMRGSGDIPNTFYELATEGLIPASENMGTSWTSADIETVNNACMAVEIVPTLVGHWECDEGPGSNVIGDASVYNRSCAFSGDPSFAEVVVGSGNYALEFDGDDAASRDALPAMSGPSVTISAWINPAAGQTSGGYYAVVSQSINDSGYQGYWLGLSDYYPGFFVGEGGGLDDTAILPNQWVHLAGTYDGVYLRTYVDGERVLRKSVNDAFGHFGTFYIGNAVDGSNGFTGLIDDVRIYNYALSDNQIKGLSKYAQYPTVFSVKDSSDESVAWIDDKGNLFLTGDLTQGTPSATANDEFRIQDSSSDVAIIDMTTGDMVVKGSVNEEVSDLSLASHFIVKDSTSNTVAYIDTLGNVFVKGKVYDNIPEL